MNLGSVNGAASRIGRDDGVARRPKCCIGAGVGATALGLTGRTPGEAAGADPP